jgi:hypothetical protein
MSQIWWIVSLIPDSVLLWIYYTLLSAGVVLLSAGWLIKWFPGISVYKTPLQLLGIVLTAGSLYLLGGYGVEMSWRAKVDALEAKVKLAEEQAAEANGKVEVKVVETTKVIREKGQDIVRYIDREVIKKEEIIKYVERCPVPKEIIDLHNQATELNRAAEGPKK